MDNAATLVQPHAAVIIDSLVAKLDSPDPRAKLAAAKLILRWAWGPAGGRRRGDAPGDTVPAGGLGAAERQRAVDLLLSRLPPGNGANPAATSCPARHEAAPPAEALEHPHANPAINPMSLEDGTPAPPVNADAVTGAARATTPCPAAKPPPPNPSINPLSLERSPSPLAAPPGTDPPYPSRRDTDPMSRAVLPPRHSADDPFRRPLPTPPPVEPPWPFVSDAQWWRARRRARWR